MEIKEMLYFFEWKNSPSVRKIPIENLRQILKLVEEATCQK